MEIAEPDYIFKFLVLGDSGVGKSSLVLRYADNVFSKAFITTIGVDFKIKTVKLGNTVIKQQIWDTAGQERFKTMTANYYRSSHGIILVYDVTDMKSFQNIQCWYDECKTYSPNNVAWILVGNKSDMTSSKVVDYTVAKAYADKLNMPFIETSAKDSSNVEQMFLTMTSDLKDKITNGELLCFQSSHKLAKIGQATTTVNTYDNKICC